MDGTTHERHVLEWDDMDVHNWMSNLGYPQYENQLKEHKIYGDSLCMLDSDGLKSIGVATIGQRLSILKGIYQLKLSHNIPIDNDQYVPPSEASERSENISFEKLHTMVKDQARQLRTLEDENRNLNTTLQTFIDEFNNLRSSLGRAGDDAVVPIRRHASFKWDYKSQRSPTKADLIDSPHPSPQRAEHDMQSQSKHTATPAAVEGLKSQIEPPSSPSANQSSHKSHKHDGLEQFKSFKVSLEDPTWKVLPAALKKYRIQNDRWQDYAMFICYGNPGNRIERCLSYDEKPLLLFQKLKDTNKNPVFMLKHIKDLRSPIVMAKQRHAARKAASLISGNEASTSTQGHHKTPSTTRAIEKPPRLEVQDLSASSSIPTLVSPQPGWQDTSLSPLVDIPRGEDASNTPVSTSNASAHTSTTSTTTLVNSTYEQPVIMVESGDQPTSSHSAREIAPHGVSYAVAIYPYMAEQEDEFDVVVGDTFVILSRARGWWVVQRDPTGAGVVETDIGKQGWVPAGCLLETNVPVASAIAEAAASKGTSTPGSSPHTPMSRTPILPLSIISTSFPGVALMDYKKRGEEELDLSKDDVLRVFKRYNHWSYVVKEDGGDRGWVPSWFIGKTAYPGNYPATPSSSVPPNPSTASSLDEVNQAQMSPMSSAFPMPRT